MCRPDINSRKRTGSLRTLLLLWNFLRILSGWTGLYRGSEYFCCLLRDLRVHVYLILFFKEMILFFLYCWKMYYFSFLASTKTFVESKRSERCQKLRVHETMLEKIMNGLKALKPKLNNVALLTGSSSNIYQKRNTNREDDETYKECLFFLKALIDKKKFNVQCLFNVSHHVFDWK